MQPATARASSHPLVIFSLQLFDSWRCAAELSRRNLEEARRLRSRMLNDMNFCIESYMRSPVFLELMRYNWALMGYPRGESADDAPAPLAAVAERLKERSSGDDPSASEDSR
jgi:hypothetical protein